jgi:hypothetical protein
MPAGPSHIPQARERAALQKMSPTRGMRLEQLHPAGKQLIASLVTKGWIEKQQDGRTYCIMPAGEAGLASPARSNAFPLMVLEAVPAACSATSAGIKKGRISATLRRSKNLYGIKRQPRQVPMYRFPQT